MNENKKASEQEKLASLTELEQLSAPLVAWLREHHNPHSKIIISWDMVEDMIGEMSIPFPYES